MNQLYPIIRRVRRPLIQENPEPPKTEILKPASEAVVQADVPPVLETKPAENPKQKKSRDDAPKN